jgi:drug/metabolite transporter (DMT)-like permease
MAGSPHARPALRGGLLALLAAALFGVSTPLVQQFGAGLGAFSTAALLYAGAAAVGLLSRQRIEREARLQRSDLPRLLAMAVFGAALGPVALAWGLQNTSGTSASLMLTLEALFTAVLAWRLYRETMDGRVWTAMALLLAGGMVLVLDQGLRSDSGGAQLWGLLAVLLATAAWGVDNTLSRALAERDPGQVVMAKALLGATATSALAWAVGEPLPSAAAALALLAIGASGYGLSLRFYLLAQRAFGAARTGSVFAFAPFIGAAFAVALGDRSASVLMALGSVADAGRRGAAPGGVARATRTPTRRWSTSTRTATTTAPHACACARAHARGRAQPPAPARAAAAYPRPRARCAPRASALTPGRKLGCSAAG